MSELSSRKEFSLRERRTVVRKIRKQCGLSLAALAKMAKLSEPMLCQFELGNRDLSEKAFERLENAIAEAVVRHKQNAERKQVSELREVAKVEKLAGRFVPYLKEHPGSMPLAVLAGGDSFAEFQESCRQMEAQYGPKWREVFGEIRDLQKEKADLEKRIAELRDLLAVETASALKASEAKELRERIAKKETIPPSEEEED